MFERFLQRLGFHRAAPEKHGDYLITVTLSRDRLSDGTLVVHQDTDQVFGPVLVLCTIDRDFAARAGNPDGDPLQPFGEIPTGRYRLLRLAKADEVPLPIDEDTGDHPIFVFRAIDGQAALSEANGRGDLLLHGGPSVPGLGVLRLDDASIAELMTVLGGSVTLEVVEQVVPLTRTRRPERTISPSGSFPMRSSSSSSTISDDDPMDGFLLSYLIGWPTNITPGAFLGAYLHEEQQDNSGANLQGLGVPVLQDDPNLGMVPLVDQGAVVDQGMPTADPQPDPQSATTPDYTPSGGTYDR